MFNRNVKEYIDDWICYLDRLDVAGLSGENRIRVYTPGATHGIHLHYAKRILPAKSNSRY